jgi:hypothetical protein
MAHHNNKIIPEIKKRMVPRTNGGKSRSEDWIKKYVEPHTIYTIANAISTVINGACFLEVSGMSLQRCIAGRDWQKFFFMKIYYEWYAGGSG